MVGYVILAFFIGGFLGVLGMAAMACGPKQKLTRDIHIMTRRLDFLEREGEKTAIFDFSVQGHSRVNG